jgi:alpha-aminoadipate carrier protein LysW
MFIGGVIMGFCPECDALIDEEFDDIGEVIVCPECGEELEVTSIDPVEFDLAPLDDEDEDEYDLDDEEDDWEETEYYDEDEEDDEYDDNGDY